MKIIALTTCYNRKDYTVKALNSLKKQYLPAGYELDICIVNDGSTDGTGETVRKLFPDIKVLEGTGDLYWAGGMRYGWEHSVSKTGFDYLLVYNDDIRLNKNAIKTLLSCSRKYVKDGGTDCHAVVAAFLGADKKGTSYGGVVKNSKWHPLRFKQVRPPEEGYIQVDTMNMNACLITRSALDRVGFLSDYFQHGGADYEYGLKLRAAGGAVILAPGYMGVCDRDIKHDESIACDRGFIEDFRRLVSVKQQPPLQRFKYYARYGGSFWVFFWLMPYMSQPFKYLVNCVLKQKSEDI